MPPFLPMAAALTAIVTARALPAATVVLLNPVADAFVTTGPTGNLSGVNYGAAGGLAVSAAGLPNGEFQTLLRFDTTPAKSEFDTVYGAGQWTIESVTLRLNATPPNNPIFHPNTAGTVRVIWTANDGWVEGAGSPSAPGAAGVTFASLQALIAADADTPVGTFSFDGGSSDAQTIPLDLSDPFATDLLAGNQVTLRATAADATVSYLFNSRSIAAPANRPLMAIAAVPEPALPALLAAAAAFAAKRRR